MGVYLTGVHLMGLCLINVHLTGVHPMSVHFMNVYLTGVNLMRVYLTGVHLTSVHFMDVYFFQIQKGFGKTFRSPSYKRRSICRDLNVIGKLWSSAIHKAPMCGHPFRNKVD
jgi:hypothetical protein